MPSKPEVVSGEAKLELRLVGKEDPEGYEEYTDAYKAGAMTLEQHKECLKAQTEYAKAHMDFQKSYDYINFRLNTSKKEKRKPLESLKTEILEADKAYKVYEQKLSDFNLLVEGYGVKGKDSVSLFDQDTDKLIQLDKWVSELGIDEAITDLKMADQTSDPKDGFEDNSAA
jgi:hypothetical protein